ncbi:MAG: TerC family protein [Hyphomicrobiaceae bacterium]
MTLSMLFEPAIWASLVSLTLLEIVLGIDNIVFLSLVIGRLPAERRSAARRLGLGLALGMRIVMLLFLTWIIGLTEPVLSAFGHDFSWRDIILLSGGLFLLAKGTHEIHRGIEGEGDEEGLPVLSGFVSIIIQVALIDFVFSIDSIVTAIGIAEHVEVMIAAVVIAMAVMYFASKGVGGFIERHPTTKMLALSFLLLIGVALVADGLHFHIPRGYIYFAMAFACAVESFNVLATRRRKHARG